MTNAEKLSVLEAALRHLSQELGQLESERRTVERRLDQHWIFFDESRKVIEGIIREMEKLCQND